MKILETSHPPSFYLPPADITGGVLYVVPGSSHCEWKGPAEYLSLSPDGAAVGWRYPRPYDEFELCRNYVSFYPDLIECRVGDEVVRAQAGGFYGGWITDDVIGPFKGDPGTSGW